MILVLCTCCKTPIVAKFTSFPMKGKDPTGLEVWDLCETCHPWQMPLDQRTFDRVVSMRESRRQRSQS